jgi:hypothetical protein
MMRLWRRVTPALAGLMIVARLGSAQQPGASPPPPTRTPLGASDEKLRNELVLRARTDQAAREAFMLKRQTGGTIDSLDVARLSAIDTANTAWLKRVIARQGWPTRAQVGAEGVRAAFLLVQQADLDTAFQARVLPLIQQSFAAGELPGGDVAMLTDLAAINHGWPQVYGTQARLVNGRWVAAPIGDSARVDERRARMGLPPIGVYFRVLDSLAAAPN